MNAARLAAELGISIADPTVWLAIGLGLLLGAVCLLVGVWLARTVGLLTVGAPAGETIGVGLASGLIVLAAWWAAVWSGGRSSFTPVAVGFAITVVLAITRRRTSSAKADDTVRTEADANAETVGRDRRPLLVALGASGVFIVAVGLLYGATMAPSPRDGVQPVEFRDMPFYAILGRDLATTGTENTLSVSGFDDIPGQPPQTWYHWGELWLAAAVIKVFGTPPIAARYFVVLPVLLLAAAAMTGTLVRRIGRTNSSRAFLLGFAACLFLAPLQLRSDFFSEVLFGLLFGITNYGLGAVVVLLALHGLLVLGKQAAPWPLVMFLGIVAASVLPAHIVLAILAAAGVGAVVALSLIRFVLTSSRPDWPPGWVGTFVVATVALGVSVLWGVVTGHSLGIGGASRVAAFNPTWLTAVAETALGTGVLFALPAAWVLARRSAHGLADIYLAAIAVVIAGAVAWGARIADYNSFYLFFGAIEVFAVPLAAAAIWQVLQYLANRRHRRAVLLLVMACTVQLGFGLAQDLLRLQDHGIGFAAPIPEATLAAISDLPTGAKLAYACRVEEEVTYGTANLLSIDAHTGHRIVPMCFVADAFGYFTGASLSLEAPSTDSWAPQRSLYPTVRATPTAASVDAFLKAHGIDYIFADSDHPNTLVPGAAAVARSGDAAVLSVP